MNFHVIKEKSAQQYVVILHKFIKELPQNVRKTIDSRTILALPKNLVSNCGMWEKT
jgi:hypothetical protein